MRFSPPKLALVCERATPEDDVSLRALIRNESMDGRIRLRFSTEPSFFGSLAIHGHRADVAVLRDRTKGEVVGVALRAEREVYLNGAPALVGYLGGLRIAKAYRGGRGLLLGFKKMKQWHDQGGAELYMTTIMAGNEAAKKALLKPRAGLPRYRPFGQIHTFVMSASVSRSIKTQANLSVENASGSSLEEMLRFLNEQGRARQFFPVLRESNIREGQLVPGLYLSDVVIARRAGKIVGTLGVWNQENFRQMCVDGYDWKTRLLRVANNISTQITNLPKLPKLGTSLRTVKLALNCAQDNDPAIFRALLKSTIINAGQRFPSAHIMLGIHAADPVGKIVEKLPHHLVASHLHICHWEDGAEAFAGLDARVPHIELGSL